MINIPLLNMRFAKKLAFIAFITFLSSCATEDIGGSNGDRNLLISAPRGVSWTPPTLNTDGTLISDLTKYRFYYGPDDTSLKAVLDIDSDGVTITSYTFTTTELEILEGLITSNSTHVFSMTAINSQNIESSFSNMVFLDNNIFL